MKIGMRVERFYHSAPSAAENTVESGRALSVASGEFSLPANLFPLGLEAAAYALKKRLICPRWWLIGVMSQWMIKDSEQLALQMSLNEGDWVLSGPAISVKSFPSVVALWTELFAKISRMEGDETLTLELELGRLLKGTSNEVFAQREFLTNYLSSALRVQKVRIQATRPSSKRSKFSNTVSTNIALEPVGLVQLVENVVLKQGTADTLLVTFSRDPRRLFTLAVEELLPAALRANGTQFSTQASRVEEFSGSIVSLQPDVLQALSRAVSPKKLCSYLSLELMKKTTDTDVESISAENQVWRGRALGLKELSKLHKEQLSRAQAFYDHGILSWENEAPKQRVRSLVGRSQSLADSGIVHCWRLSQHALDAVQFESSLSQVLRRDDSVPLELNGTSSARRTLCSEEIIEKTESLKSGESKVQKAIFGGLNDALEQTSLNGSARVPPSVAPALQSHLNRSERLVTGVEAKLNEQDSVSRTSSTRPVVQVNSREQKRSTDVWNDDEFLMCVAEFYESLTPLQQQAFERERRKMSPEEFKKYVTPALLRLRNRH